MSEPISLCPAIDENSEKLFLKHGIIFPVEQEIQVDASLSYSQHHFNMKVINQYPHFSDQKIYLATNTIWGIAFYFDIGQEIYLQACDKKYKHHGKILSNYIFYDEKLGLYHIRKVDWMEKFIE